MNRVICLVVLFAAVPAVAQIGYQWGWQKTDTLTAGDYDDLNPEVDNGGSHPYGYWQQFPAWVVFERWNGDESSIAAVKYSGVQQGWDQSVYTISPFTPGLMQGLPDVCTMSHWVHVSSDYELQASALIVWEEKSDSTWNISYSTLDTGSSSWSPPCRLTNDSVDDENPIVRLLTDTSFVILWKSDSTLCYSIVRDGSFSQPRKLVRSNTDSVEFDFYHYAYRSYTAVVWTQKRSDGSLYCIVGSISVSDSLSISTRDTISVTGSIGRPRFRMAYLPVLTFDVQDSGRYEAWTSQYASDQWLTDSVADDSNSDNLHLDFYGPTNLVTGLRMNKNSNVPLPWGFWVWECRTKTDTFLVFSNPDTVASAGFDRDPHIAVNTYFVGNGTAKGFAVFESNRTGKSHIYSRLFIYSLGAIDDLHYPTQFKLLQNYPNPFNPTTTIRYQLSAISDVRLTIYDVLGRKVETLVDSRQAPGGHSVVFDGRGLASGVYFYRLAAGDMVRVKKMLLVK